MSAVDPEVQAAVDGCRRAHERLLGAAEGLDDAEVRAPSLLPDWSRAHVLTHLARNADSHTRMLGAALAGEAVEQYAGGAQERAAAIAAGADRPADAVRADVARSVAGLEAAWAAMTPAAWDGHGLARGTPWPCRSMPAMRRREVEIHLVDLGTGLTPGAWPEDYVQAELPRALAGLPERLDPDGRRALLAWLVGRRPDPGPLPLRPWEERPGGYLRGVT